MGELELVKDRWVTSECTYDWELVDVAVPELLQNITHSSVSSLVRLERVEYACTF